MFKKILPNNLLFRLIAIILFPLIIVQIFFIVIFIQKHWEHTNLSFAKIIAGQVSFINGNIKQAKNQEEIEEQFALAKEYFDIYVRIQNFQDLPDTRKGPYFSTLPLAIDAQMNKRVNEKYWFSTNIYAKYIEIRVAYGDGFINFLVARNRIYTQSATIFIFWLILFSLAIGWIAIAFMRGQVKSIIKLSDAVESFGQGNYNFDFTPTGAKEIRRAGQSFLAMRKRIKEFISQRTYVLAAVSHDIRTPLTRLKLSLELPFSEKEKINMKADINDMEYILEEYLTFAKGSEEEKPSFFDLEKFIIELQKKCQRSNQNFIIKSINCLKFFGRRQAMARLLLNIISNACKHAKKIELSSQIKDNNLIVTIDDDGPGLSDEDKEKVFKAFFIKDRARNQNQSSIGLGMTIAGDIAKIHGGNIKLTDSYLGGLACNIILPLKHNSKN